MSPDNRRDATPLIRTVAFLQVKLIVGAARDVILSPLTLAAAFADLVLLRRQEPRFLRAVLRLGERSEEWIDLWSGARDDVEPSRANVDLLLARVEEVVRDPQTGARRARVLRRWAERQIAQARRAGSARATDVSTRAAPPRTPPAGPDA